MVAGFTSFTLWVATLLVTEVADVTGANATAQITNQTGLFIQTGADTAATNAGATIQNQYGLSIASVNDGSVLNYAIRTAGGKVSFGDNLEFRNRNFYISFGDPASATVPQSFIKPFDATNGIHLNHNTITSTDSGSAFLLGGTDMGAIEFEPNSTSTTFKSFIL